MLRFKETTEFYLEELITFKDTDDITTFIDETTKGMEDDDEEMIEPYFFERIIEVFQDGGLSRDDFLPRSQINVIAYMHNKIIEPEDEESIGSDMKTDE
jgi:hypothetical protein